MNGITVLASVFGVLGTIAGIVGTVAGIRSSSARRYAERGTDAASLLTALTAAEGSGFVPEDSDRKLRLELGRVVRESAAVYATQYPTPAGNDAVRSLSAVYAAMLGGFGIYFVAMSIFEHSERRTASQIIGGLFLFLAMLLAAIALTLRERVKRRNDARTLSGTPGQEHFFESVHSTAHDFQRRQVARRALREAKRLTEHTQSSTNNAEDL